MRIPQICLFLTRFWAGERYKVLSICLWIQNSTEDQIKVELLRIPQQIWFWPVSESFYIAQNAQSGLLMISFPLSFSPPPSLSLSLSLSQFSGDQYLIAYRN